MPNTLLLFATLYCAFLAGQLYLKATSPPGSVRSLAMAPPRATLALTLVTGASVLLQWLFPPLLAALERNATLIAAGEWWRLGTALFVQRGGATGTVFNLASLVLLGSIAEHMLGARRWLATYIVGGVLTEVVAMAWQPIGAGNSVANFSLGGAVSIVCAIRRPARSVFIAAIVALGCAVALLLQRDIHGAAMTIGAAMALVEVLSVLSSDF